MVTSSLPLDRPNGSKKPAGGKTPTTVSSIHALSWVDAGTVFLAGAKAALKVYQFVYLWFLLLQWRSKK